ncbi:MAG TPA: ABC transporter permease [bacterium]|nr:ABC transporter permease [bacterium]
MSVHGWASGTARHRPGVPWPLGAAGVLLLGYLIVPFCFGVASLDGSVLLSAVRGAAAAGAIWTSVLTATISTLIVVVLGVPLGYVLARTEFVGKGLVTAFVYLPLVIPPLVGGVLLLVTFGPYTPLGGWLGMRGLQITDALPGIVLSQTFVAAPYLIVASRVAFEAIEPSFEQVSYTLGKSPLVTFFRVSLPLAWPGILAGVPLAWLRALGEFGATIMVAYHPSTLPVYLFVQFGARGLREALPVAVVLVAIGAAVVALVQGVGARAQRRAMP